MLSFYEFKIFAKSYEGWLEKLWRGSGDSNYSRQYEDFFKHNPDMEYCREEVFPAQEYEVSNKLTDVKDSSVCNHKNDKNRTFCDENETFYVCAIIKDEHPYIREWVLYNRSIGFDKIVLYDNGSSRPYDGELGDLTDGGFVEIREWCDETPKRQIDAYNHFVRSGNWSDGDYCAFLDPDEFVVFDDVKTVGEFMKLYAGFSGVGLSWRTYNADGRIDSPNESVPTMEAYTTEFDYKEPRIKMIGRLSDIEEVFSPHAFRPKEGRPPLVTTGGEEIVHQYPHYRDYTNGHIKHFFTKSWEDWVRRLKRGNITRGLRLVDTFFDFNPEMAHLREMLINDLDFGQFPTI
jgi:hypothetical protein